VPVVPCCPDCDWREARLFTCGLCVYLARQESCRPLTRSGVLIPRSNGKRNGRECDSLTRNAIPVLVHARAAPPFCAFFHARVPLVVACETSIKERSARKRCVGGDTSHERDELSVAIPFAFQNLGRSKNQSFCSPARFRAVSVRRSLFDPDPLLPFGGNAGTALPRGFPSSAESECHMTDLTWLQKTVPGARKQLEAQPNMGQPRML
jgi:hypothetical protein